jgi:hypothetical protein
MEVKKVELRVNGDDGSSYFIVLEDIEDFYIENETEEIDPLDGFKQIRQTGVVEFRIRGRRVRG